MDNDLKEFIDRYIGRGFGSMNKNDFEVEIFHYLLKTNYFKSLKEYDISIQLKIPQSKVKRLKYEADLKFPKENKDEMIKDILDNAKISFDRKCLVLSIEDEIIRKYLDCEIKKHNGYSDLSFNTELMRLDFEDYIYLVDKIEGGKRVDEIKGKLESWFLSKENGDKEKLKKIRFKDLFFEFVKGFAKGAGVETGKLTIKVLFGTLGII
ncbi:MAG: hypothetical protein J5709_10500 [Bacteroidales bacterium]|nr:hypothetical protein [Bacteroidales bacterium]